jgi:hypothetical protein
MQARRFACFVLGLWLAGGLFMAWVATQNFRQVDRLLSRTDPTATLHVVELGANARPMMRFQASEINRWLFRSWEILQLFGGFAFLFVLLFWGQEDKFVLGGILLLLALTMLQRFLLTPEIVALGRMLDFVPANLPSGERTQFWIAHSAYSGVELAKWAVMLVLTGRMVFSSRGSGRSRDSRNQLDRVDKADYRGVDG